MTLVPSRDITSIRWRIADVQPTDAQQWLATLRPPRPVRPSLMRAYARDMITGHWQLNGVPLIFDRDGRLLDGQTRLEACIAAVRGFRTLIVENVGPEAFVTIDNTRHRALGAILGLRQETGGAILASTLIFVWQYYFNSRDNLRFRPSVPELLYILEARPQIREELSLAMNYRAVIRPSVATALLHLGGRVDRPLTQAFLDDLANEALSDPTHPAVAFRNAVARMPARARHVGRTAIMNMAIQAWNAARAGETLSHLAPQADTGRLIAVAGLGHDDGLDLIGTASLGRTAPADGDEALSVSAEIVTAEVAARLLANNPRNRPIDRPTVERYKRDMMAGKWALNGQTIKLANDGRLIDGQHRCRAALEARCAFPTLVVANLSESAFDTLDLGRRRGFCEILRANGERNVTSVAAAARVLWMLENAPDGRKVPSPTELLDYFDRVSAIRDSAGNFRAKFKGMMHGSASAALHFIFSHEDAVKADEFFARLRDGANLDKTSPILMLRNRLIESDLSATTVMSEREKMALTIKAWRAFIDGKPLRSLRWVERGPQAEPFPDLAWRADQ